MNHNYVQSHEEQSKLNSAINANSGAHILDDKINSKSPFNKYNVATIKCK